MRMWMIDTKILCRKHLLGEHVEIHMLIGHLNKKRSIKGFVKNNLIEVKSIITRHEELVNEMISRGYNHNSPLKEFNIDYLISEEKDYIVDPVSSLNDLIGRCSECNKNYSDIKNK